MKKVLRGFGLLMAAWMFLWIVGCGGGNDDDDCDSADNVSPTVTLSPNGGAVSSNVIVTATFNKAVETVTVTGATPISTDNKVWTFSLPEGDDQVVTVEGTDFCGDSGSASATFNVEGHNHGANIVGDGCKPKDGSVDVDPANVSEIILAFDEALADTKVTRFEPEAQINAAIDGSTVIISFLGGFTLSNEQEVVLELTVMDVSGSSTEIEYSFTTKAKE